VNKAARNGALGQIDSGGEFKNCAGIMQSIQEAQFWHTPILYNIADPLESLAAREQAHATVAI
jgi:hypothetical protein